MPNLQELAQLGQSGLDRLMLRRIGERLRCGHREHHLGLDAVGAGGLLGKEVECLP